MSNFIPSASRGPSTNAAFVHARSQISAITPRPWRRRRQTAGLVALLVVGGGCGSSLQPNPDAQPNPDSQSNPDSQANPDVAAALCAQIQQAYSDALTKAQECTVGASGQCGVQVRASFWCNCTTWVNGGADALAAIASQYQAAGCQSICNGVCAQPQSLVCTDDATSSTGARCKPPALLNLTGASDGGSFAVPVGYEIDILLQNIGPSDYSMDVTLSSDAVTVLEVTIPAGTPNPGGPTYLYRLKAVSAGQVTVTIPRLPLPTDASLPAFTITLNIS